MNYPMALPATFIARPNRFVAEVELAGERVSCHVKNTGRCRELLLPGARVYLAPGAGASRRTAYDLVAVEKGGLLINMDSQAPNAAAAEYLAARFPSAEIRREVRYRDSRFDFQLTEGDGRIFVEVKGVTLERDGIAYFPDAPTARGAKHLRELRECLLEGYRAAVLFLVQMKGPREMRPNAATDPEFARQLLLAREAGVELWAADCLVTPGSMRPDAPLPVVLRP